MNRKRKNGLWIVTVGVLLLSLAACGGQPAALDASAGSTELTEDYEDALTIKNQLLLGTLRLEGTDQAVTGTQAQALLPLWQAYAALTASGTAATKEIESVQNQIVEALTEEQVAEIDYIRILADTRDSRL